MIQPPFADDTPFEVQSLRLGPRGDGETSNDDVDIQYARYPIYCAAVFGSKGFQLRRLQPADSTQTLSEPISGVELGMTRSSHLLEGQNTAFRNPTPTFHAAHRDLCSNAEGLILARFTTTNLQLKPLPKRKHVRNPDVAEASLPQKSVSYSAKGPCLHKSLQQKQHDHHQSSQLVHSCNPKCRLRKQVVKNARANPQSLQDRKQPAERHSLPRCYWEQVA